MERQRLVWCDAVRLLAFFLLFACHAADPINASVMYGTAAGEPVDPQLTVWGARWGALVRPCVPLFVMLTGVLSLPVGMPMEQFYKRRLPRVIYPFQSEVFPPKPAPIFTHVSQKTSTPKKISAVNCQLSIICLSLWLF